MGKETPEKQLVTLLSEAVAEQKTSDNLIYTVLNKYAEKYGSANNLPTFKTARDFQYWIDKQSYREWHIYILPEGEIMFIKGLGHEQLAATLMEIIDSMSGSNITEQIDKRFKNPQLHKLIKEVSRQSQKDSKSEFGKDLRPIDGYLNTLSERLNGDADKLVNYTGVIRLWYAKGSRSVVTVPVNCFYGHQVTGAQDDTISYMIKYALLAHEDDDSCLKRSQGECSNVLMSYGKVQNFCAKYGPSQKAGKINVK